MDQILRFLMNPSPPFVLLFMGTIVGLLLLIVLQARRRVPEEAGKTPIYSTIGGGRIGWLNYRGPFISLRLYEDFLVIRALQTIVLPYAEIESVEVKKWLGMTPDRIQIAHRSLHAPETIIVGVSNPARVKEMIDQRLLG